MNNSPVGIFDSGIGGISVLNECRSVLPRENFIYLADSENAPYGNRSADEILALARACVNTLLSRGVKAIVAACNTATSVAAATLRQTLDVPLIGLEPAIKPAYEHCKDKETLLLCTAATSKQEKFINLVKEYGDMNLSILPQKHLAAYIEKNIGDGNAMRKITEEIFRDKTHVSGIILGCTHYVFLKPFIAEFFGKCGNGGVMIFDGNAGAARRLKAVLTKSDALAERTERGAVEFI